MSNPSPIDTDETEGKLIFPIIYFFVGSFIAMDLWSAIEPTAWNWGIHFLAFYGIEVRIAVSLLMLVIMIPSVQYYLIDLIRAIAELEEDRSPVVRWILGVLAVVGIAFAFAHFRTATYFLGDGYLQLRSLKVPENMENLNLNGFAREPLVGFFVFQLCHLFSFLESITPPEDAYMWLSALSGVGFTIIAWKGIGLFVAEEADRILVLFFLLASGVSILFFGYVENYAPGYVGIFFFLLLGTGYLKEKISIYWAMAAFGLLLSMNFGAVSFLPAFAYLAYVGFRRREAAETGAALFISGAVFIAMLAVSGYSPSFFREVFSDAGTDILPFGSPAGKNEAYGMFSLSHAADMSNLFLLCTPAAVALLVVALVATLKKRRPLETSEWFLLLAMGCGVGLIAVLNCTLGMSRDWDIAAPFSVGIPVAAIAIWTAVTDNKETRQRVLLILGVITLLQTGSWVTLNADAHSAVARFEILEEKRLWGTQACLDAYEELAIYHRDRREFFQAAACYERYVALDSTNDRVWLNCARMEQADGNFSKAINAYKELVLLKPLNPDFIAPLGVLLAQTGHFDEGLFYLQEAEKLSPASPKIKNDIGAVFANQKDYAKALPYFLESVRLDPNFQGGYLNTAACYAALGDKEKAQEYRAMARRKQ
jgi:Flp pilus assembly protein TadD